MNLKSASFLACIGTALSALYTLWTLFSNLAGIAQGVVPPVVLFSSVIHAFTYIALTLFFWTYHNAQK